MKNMIKTGVLAITITVSAIACGGNTSDSSGADSAATDTGVTMLNDSSAVDSGTSASYKEGSGKVTASDTAARANNPDSTKK